MRNISIQLDEDLFRKFAIACAELGAQKKTLIINFIKSFIEDKEDEKILKLAEKRLKDYESGKLKLVSHKDAWK